MEEWWRGGLLFEEVSHAMASRGEGVRRGGGGGDMMREREESGNEGGARGEGREGSMTCGGSVAHALAPCGNEGRGEERCEMGRGRAAEESGMRWGRGRAGEGWRSRPPRAGTGGARGGVGADRGPRDSVGVLLHPHGPQSGAQVAHSPQRERGEHRGHARRAHP